MDRVKAIKVLKPLIDSYVDYANISMKEEDDDIVEALEMAVEALDVPDTNVGDMISRQMAIDALFELYEYQRDIDPTEVADLVRQGIFLAEKKIEKLPSAQPERKKGEWINRSLNIVYPVWERYTCSVCGKHSYSYDFCPNCGSYNGGESE